MDYIRDRKSNISFSLHDSRILQIENNEDKLSLNMTEFPEMFRSVHYFRIKPLFYNSVDDIDYRTDSQHLKQHNIMH